MSNPFELEPLIIQRLREPPLAGIRAVMGVCELDGGDQGQTLPAIYVLSAGDEPIQSVAGQQLILQRWVVVLALHPARPATGRGVLHEAGELLEEIITRLHGWKPATGYNPLVREHSPPPLHEEEASYFSVMFAARHVWRTA